MLADGVVSVYPGSPANVRSTLACLSQPTLCPAAARLPRGVSTGATTPRINGTTLSAADHGHSAVCVCVCLWLKPDGSWCLMISQALSGGRGGRSNSISGQTMAIVFSSLTILYLRPSVYMYKGKAIVFRPSVDMFIGRHGPIVQHCSLPGLVSCCNALGGFVSNITIPSVLDHILPMSYYTSNQY